MHGFILTLAVWFALGTAFYAFRLVSPAYLKRVNGYYDIENEFWHGACLLGMVACLTPWILPAPAMFWSILFGVGTVSYLVRAFTWGKSRPFNKQWYDFAHAAMLGGMGWMFASPVVHPLATIAWTAYWVWFGSYYLYRVWNDFKNSTGTFPWLGFGQDIAHLTMAIVMALMTVWPATFMPYHNHGQHQLQDGSLCTSPGTESPQVKPTVPGSPALDAPDHAGHHHQH